MKKYRCVHKGNQSYIQTHVDKTLFGGAWETLFSFSGCPVHAERIASLLNIAEEITSQNVSKR